MGANRYEGAGFGPRESRGRHDEIDRLSVTISDVMSKVLAGRPIPPGGGILHHPEGFDLMPSDIQLSGMEASLVYAMSWEPVSLAIPSKLGFAASITASALN